MTGVGGATEWKGEGAAWDELLGATDSPHLLQSFRWGELQSRFGWRLRRVLIEAGGRRVPVSIQVAATSVPGGRYGYVPKGPATGRAAFAEGAAALADVAREEGLAFIRVEPELEAPAEPPPGWVVGPPREPEHTAVIDLSAEPGELLASFKPKTRYNVRLAQKKGVRVELSEDIDTFAGLTGETQARHGIHLDSPAYLRSLRDTFAGDGSCRLYMARHNGDVLAGIMVLRFGGRATYLKGASADTGRNLMPAYLLHWHAMQELKDLGDTSYDLGGLPPNGEPGHPWSGLWQFKTGWNGRFVAYAGAFDLPLQRAVWLAHNTVSKVRSSVRRAASRLGQSA